MKAASYFSVLLLSLVCAALVVAVIAVSTVASGLTERIQLQQERLNTGVLGQQAQQISSQVLTEMGNVATTNALMKKLLEKNGYQLSAAPVAATNAPLPAARPGGRP
jgi:type II secretory pathway component PulK